MVWSDEPSDAQLNALFMLIRWTVPTKVAHDAVSWLSEHATRREVSDELGRIKKLNVTRNLSVLNCFESEIWEGFEHE